MDQVCTNDQLSPKSMSVQYTLIHHPQRTQQSLRIQGYKKDSQEVKNRNCQERSNSRTTKQIYSQIGQQDSSSNKEIKQRTPSSLHYFYVNKPSQFCSTQQQQQKNQKVTYRPLSQFQNSFNSLNSQEPSVSKRVNTESELSERYLGEQQDKHTQKGTATLYESSSKYFSSQNPLLKNQIERMLNGFEGRKKKSSYQSSPSSQINQSNSQDYSLSRQDPESLITQKNHQLLLYKIDKYETLIKLQKNLLTENEESFQQKYKSQNDLITTQNTTIVQFKEEIVQYQHEAQILETLNQQSYARISQFQIEIKQIEEQGLSRYLLSQNICQDIESKLRGSQQLVCQLNIKNDQILLDNEVANSMVNEVKDIQKQQQLIICKLLNNNQVQQQQDFDVMVESHDIKLKQIDINKIRDESLSIYKFHQILVQKQLDSLQQEIIRNNLIQQQLSQRIKTMKVQNTRNQSLDGYQKLINQSAKLVDLLQQEKKELEQTCIDLILEKDQIEKRLTVFYQYIQEDKSQFRPVSTLNSRQASVNGLFNKRMTHDSKTIVLDGKNYDSDEENQHQFIPFNTPSAEKHRSNMKTQDKKTMDLRNTLKGIH